MSDSEHKQPNAPVVEGAEMVKLAVEAWKKTVDVQQHFNDLELRVRNFAITFTAAVLGLVGWALKEGVDSFLPVGLLAIGTLGWVAFYLMDRHWYHRYLDGAVKHGQAIEEWLRTVTGTEVFSLASGIKQASGIPLSKRREGVWPWLVGRFVKEGRLRSHHRINLFYWSFMGAFALLTWAFYTHTGKPGACANPPQALAPSASNSSVISARALVAPPTDQPASPPSQEDRAQPDAPVCTERR
jgi:hypothetical protein